MIKLKNIDDGHLIEECFNARTLNNFVPHVRLRKFSCIWRRNFTDWLDDDTILKGLELAAHGRSNVKVTSPNVWYSFSSYLKTIDYQNKIYKLTDPVMDKFKFFCRQNNVSAHRETDGNSSTYLLPIHLRENHWSLAVYVAGNPVIYYMDSMNRLNDKDALPQKPYLLAIKAWTKIILGRDLPVVSIKEVPQQNDSHSCGLHVILNGKKVIEQAESYTDINRDCRRARFELWNAIAVQITNEIIAPPEGNANDIEGTKATSKRNDMPQCTFVSKKREKPTDSICEIPKKVRRASSLARPILFEEKSITEINSKQNVEFVSIIKPQQRLKICLLNGRFWK